MQAASLTHVDHCTSYITPYLSPALPGKCCPHKDTHTHNDVQGEQLDERLAVPRLRVRKDWFLGLADDPISHDHPDAGDKKDAELGFVGAGKARQAAAVIPGH